MADYFANPKVFSGPSVAILGLLTFGPWQSKWPVQAGPPVLKLVPGCVVMFVQGTNVGHSCFAIDANKVGGYNQAGWFWLGKANEHTKHHTSEVRWRGADYPLDVETNVANHWCQLKAVDGEAAKRFVVQKYKKK